MFFKIIYSVFLIVSLYYPTVPIMGPVSLRHILTLVMIFLCIIEGGFKLDKFLRLYLVFLFFHFLSALITGFIIPVVSKLLGTYLASIVLYMSTKIMIKKYNADNLIIGTLVILGLLNSLVCIGQFFQLPLADEIPELLNIQFSEEDLNRMEKINDYQGYGVGGMMGVLASGYFLSATCILALYYPKGRIRFINWVIFAIILFGLYLVQERSGMVAGLLFSFLFIALATSHKRRNLVTAFAVIGLIAFLFLQIGPRFVNFNEMRYVSAGMTDRDRSALALNALRWVFHNPLGGNYAYYATGGAYSHNFISNAYLYGGFLGGTLILVIMFAQLKKMSIIIWNFFENKQYSTLIIAAACVYFCYFTNSIVHNYSLVLGGEMIILLLAIISARLDIEEEGHNSMHTIL